MDPATISALMAALGPILNMITGKEGEFKSSYNPQQLDFMKQGLGGLNPQMGNINQNPTFQGGNEWLQNLFSDPEFFKSFSAPIMRDFEENTIPNLANRFAGMGSGGSLGSTAFRNQLGRESSTLHEKLATLKGGLQQTGVNQALQYGQAPVSNYMQQLQQLLQPTQNVYQPGLFG